MNYFFIRLTMGFGPDRYAVFLVARFNSLITKLPKRSAFFHIEAKQTEKLGQRHEGRS